MRWVGGLKPAIADVFAKVRESGTLQPDKRGRCDRSDYTEHPIDSGHLSRGYIAVRHPRGSDPEGHWYARSSLIVTLCLPRGERGCGSRRWSRPVPSL